MKLTAIILTLTLTVAAGAAESPSQDSVASVNESTSAQPLLAKKESDIVVNLDASKKATPVDSPWMRMFAGLAIAAILSAGTYVFLKKSKAKAKAGEPAPDIKILTQHYLGPKKSLAIIRVAGESILIGVTDSNINLIKSLSLLDEDIPENVPKNFDYAMAKAEDGDDFSISGIKEVVTSRLKTMRSFQ